jgi:hypothetical protein
MIAAWNGPGVIMNRWRTTLAAALLLALLGGCGDDGDDGDDGGDAATPSEAEAWAEEVCGSAAAWSASVDAVEETLANPAGLTAEDVRAQFDAVELATEELAASLVSLSPPDTEAGQEAEQLLNDLSDELSGQRQAIDSATDLPAASAQELLAKASNVTGAMSTMLSDIKTTVTEIRELEGADELRTAFESADACAPYAVGGGGG